MIRLHDAIFGFFQRAFEDWLLGLAARLVFAGVLLVYFWNSFLTKVAAPDGSWFELAGGGSNAFAQIYGSNSALVNAVFYDFSAIPMWPWGALVYVGTYAEIVLPVLIVIGFMTRIASVGMLVFIAVMSWVDITGELVPPGLVISGYEAPAEGTPAPGPGPHGGVEAETIGAWFDGDPGSGIVDQRSLWAFLLLYLVFRGAGAVSLDRLLGGSREEEDDEPY